MSERDGANIYAEFKDWLRDRVVYDKNTLYPATVKQLTRQFPRYHDCSAEVLATLIEEMNGDEAVFTKLTTGQIVPCYRNLRLVVWNETS